MLRSLLPGLLVGALLLVGAVGCGGSSDDEDATAALEEYLTAVRDGDATGVCERMSAETFADLEASGSCEEVMEGGFDLIGEERVEIPDYEIEDVSVDGDSAEATLVSDATEDPISLVREGGEWKLAGATALDQFHPDSPLGSGEVGG